MFALALAGALLFSSSASAGDWPRFRGPQGDGISTESGLDFSGPREKLWQADVGLGYSAPVVGEGKVIVAGHDGQETDTLYCFDEASGKTLWTHSYPQPLGDRYFQGGTTGSATLEDGRVYFNAREGEIFCLDAGDGSVVWQKHLQKDFGYEKPEWGFSGAPMPRGDVLYVNAGDAGLALAAADGSLRWKSENGVAGYSTPAFFEKNGRRLAIFTNKRAYVCVDAAIGEEVWRHRWMTRYGVNAADPIVAGNSIFISTGYGKGAALLEWSGEGEPETVWKSRDMKTQMNAAILVDGYLYGIDGNEGNDQTALKCLELATGETAWSEPGVGHGTVTVADGKLVVLTEQGELQVAPVSPESYRPALKQKVLPGKVWTVPVVANGRLYCRDEKGHFVALKLK